MQLGGGLESAQEAWKVLGFWIPYEPNVFSVPFPFSSSFFPLPAPQPPASLLL